MTATKTRINLTVINLFGFKAFFNLFSVYSFCGSLVSGTITLSPRPVAPVCGAGNDLQLTCSTNGTVLRWIFTVRNEQGSLQEYPRLISQDGSQQTHESEITVNSTTFTFMRTSAEQISPLTSTLVVSSVNSALNGIEVQCVDVGTSTTAMTTIHLYDTNSASPITLEISQEYRTNNISVTVEWTSEESNVHYNINVTPSVPKTFIKNTVNVVQLIVLYNIEYNVSLETVDVCRSKPPSNRQLFYVQCKDLQLEVAKDSNPVLMYSDLNRIKGTTVSFTCPPGLVLNGTIPVTCTGNGEWEPDSQDVKCIEVKCGRPIIDSQVEVVGHDGLTADVGLVVRFICPPEMSLIGPNSSTCTGNGEWEPNPSEVMCEQGRSNELLCRDGKIAVASSVTVFAVASIVFFTVGFLCGHFCQKKRKSNTSAATAESVPPLATGGEQTQIPYYDDVVLQQEAVELKDNVAYGPIQ